MPIVLTAHLKAKDAAAADKIAEHLKEVAAFSNSADEPGTNIFYPVRSAKDPLEFTVFEEYKDKAALQAHASSAPSKAFAKAAPGLLGAKLRLDFHEQVVPGDGAWGRGAKL